MQTGINLDDLKSLKQSAEFKISNQHLAYQEFIEGKTRLESRPFKYIIEMTQNCNFKCVMCPQSFDPKFKNYSKDLNMNPEVFRRLAEQVFPYASFVDLRGFGETTILPWWPETVEYLAGFPLIEWHLVTNMSIPKPELWARMIQVGFSLGVSFDGATAQTFEAIRKKAKFDRILENLRSSTDAVKKFNSGFVYFISTIQSLNYHEMPDIVRLASEYNVPEVQFKMVQGGVNSLGSVSSQDISKYSKEAIAVAIASGVRVNFNDWKFTEGLDRDWVRSADQIRVQRAPHPLEQFFSAKDAGLQGLITDTHKVSVAQKCFKPFSFLYINYLGKAGTCNHMMYPDLLEMGDFSSMSLSEVWNSSSYQDFRSQLLSARPQDPRCQWCFKHRLED